jgi:hypothetical protein
VSILRQVAHRTTQWRLIVLVLLVLLVLVVVALHIHWRRLLVLSRVL